MWRPAIKKHIVKAAQNLDPVVFAKICEKAIVTQMTDKDR
jgi:hypothetical protein